MAEPEFVNVGRVGRPHGLDGSFVVERPSEDESHFRVGAVLYAGGKPAEVELTAEDGRERTLLGQPREDVRDECEDVELHGRVRVPRAVRSVSRDPVRRPVGDDERPDQVAARDASPRARVA